MGGARSVSILLLAGPILGCTNLFYQPTREEYFAPSEKVGLHCEDISFESLDKTSLHGWWFAAQGDRPAKGTVIQFHGNAENMTSHFLSTVWVVKEGYNFFTFDYRGYGASKGSPYPAGVHQDALAAMEFVRKRVSNQDHSVILYGQSLGGAIALRALEDVTNRNFIRAAVIESSFLSYKSMGMEALSRFWLTWPIQWMSFLLVTDAYSPKKQFSNLAGIPILYIHGEKDPIVPISQGKMLFDAAPEPKCFWSIDSDVHGHLMSVEKGKYRKDLIHFLETQQCGEITSPKGT